MEGTSGISEPWLATKWWTLGARSAGPTTFAAISAPIMCAVTTMPQLVFQSIQPLHAGRILTPRFGATRTPMPWSVVATIKRPGAGTALRGMAKVGATVSASGKTELASDRVRGSGHKSRSAVRPSHICCDQVSQSRELEDLLALYLVSLSPTSRDR